MTLITGFTCPPTIYFKFITKCDKCYYKVRQLFFITKCDSFFITKCEKCDYKVRQVLQSVTILLQSATGITKCDDYYKVQQYNCHSEVSKGNENHEIHYIPSTDMTRVFRDVLKYVHKNNEYSEGSLLNRSITTTTTTTTTKTTTHFIKKQIFTISIAPTHK